MKQDFITYLPSEIISEILLKLPARTILSCKRVCKSWHDLILTHEFVNLHLSKSVPGLALIVEPNSMGKIIEHTDDLHFGTITKLNFTQSQPASIVGSVDGLLLLRCNWNNTKELFLCNPITREFIKLPHFHSPFRKLEIPICGFGASKISGQYKVVGIFHDQTKIWKMQKLPESECKVYTIGTGSWRSIAPHARVHYNTGEIGAFVNGSLHWLVDDFNGTPLISCFDLETEIFTTFSHRSLRNSDQMTKVLLFALNGSLCLCEYACNDYMVTIWIMKEYGVEKSWTEEFVISCLHDLKWIFPVKIISKDAIIVRTYDSDFLLYYSTKNKITHRICNFNGRVYMGLHSHTPSIISLSYFRMENLFSFRSFLKLAFNV